MSSQIRDETKKYVKSQSEKYKNAGIERDSHGNVSKAQQKEYAERDTDSAESKKAEKVRKKLLDEGYNPRTADAYAICEYLYQKKTRLPPTPASPKSKPVSPPKSKPTSPKSKPVSPPKSKPTSPKSKPASPKSKPVASPKSKPASPPKSKPVSAPKSKPASSPKSKPVSLPKLKSKPLTGGSVANTIPEEWM